MILHRVLLAAIVLGYASYRDLRVREVDDRVWFASSILGASVILYEYLVGELQEAPTLLIVSVVISAALAWGFYWTGFYGGADAKALVTLSLVVPVYRPPFYLHPVAPLIVLTNGLIITLILPVTLFLWNAARFLRREGIFRGFEAEPRWRKIAASFIGFRSRTATSFHYSIERIHDHTKRFKLSFLDAGEEFARGEDMWVTPGLPLILFMALGFLLMVVFGDALTPLLKP